MGSFILSGLLINLAILVIIFAVLSLIIRYSIDKSKLTVEVRELKEHVIEIKKELRNKASQ